jgi:HAD superfamily hydrolase (TIGR01549 family)
MTASLQGVIFDMDGTLTLPGAIDFAAMRKRSGTPRGTDLLVHAATHPDPVERSRIHAVLVDEEELGFTRAQLMPDLDVLLDFLELHEVRMAILTRNNDDIMARTVAMMRRKPGTFSVMLSRSFEPSKPNPEPIRFICDSWGCKPSDVVMVGDSIDDMLCGRAAGSHTVLVGSPAQHGHDDALPLSDAAVVSLTHVIGVLQAWYPHLSR